MIKSKKTIIAGILGNALEWYDFTAYAFFAPVFAELFFPMYDPYISLIMTFSVFAIGFFTRPLGGLFFGLVGDRFGRRKALIFSIILMSVPTLLLGCLPTYAIIGLAAPLLLTALRILQSAAVSGELPSAAAFLIEHAGQRRRGLAGSLVMCSAFLGITLSAAITAIINGLLSHEQIISWGWRLAFILGGLAGLFGILVRLQSVETGLYENIKKTNIDSLGSPLGNIFKEKQLWLAILLTCVMAVANWYFIGYFNSYLIKSIGLPMKWVSLINFCCLAIFTVLIPVAGIISDIIGRKPVLKLGIAGFIIFTLPIFYLLNYGTITAAFFGELIFACILACISAIIPTALAELFHVRTRNSGMALGYNISLALFGGTAPLIAIFLVAHTHNNYAPAYYLIFCSIVSAMALSRIKESFRNTLT
jgi:proline/betaine transport protein TphA